MKTTLLTPIKTLPGIGPVLAKKFSLLGLETLQDALWYLPFRHEDWRRLTTIDQLQAGDEATVKVTVENLLARKAWKAHISLTEARVKDDHETFMKIVWFNMPYLAKSLKVGDQIFVSGTAQVYKETLQMQNPAFEPVSPNPQHQALVPVYRSTSGLSQRQLRRVIQQAVDLVDILPDPLPVELLDAHGLVSIREALRDIHFPKNPLDMAAALRRLKMEELLAWEWKVEETESERIKFPAPVLRFHETEIRSFVQRLPFELTSDQRVSTWNILQDMEKQTPMYRLLQGDVGSGKTVVAAISAYNVVLSRQQVAFLAPTVILAEQHFQSWVSFFEHRDVVIALWTSGGIRLNTTQTTLPLNDFYQALAEGQIHMVIGTQAVFDEDAQFHNLGLVIVDEQQRFGVSQRHLLIEKNIAAAQRSPHFLSLTATPIPRTVALALMGSLQVSALREKPPGRIPIRSKAIGPDERATVDETIEKTIAKHEQVFVITPLIEESDTLGVKAATTEHERITQRFPHAVVGLVHGSMKPADRVTVMNDFYAGHINILVSTTVIEVGVDVPNATLMVIEGSERFGLAQLHQLRGRVGRSDKTSTCLFVTDSHSEPVMTRLKALAKNQDGFAIAELDLQERGSGDVYGVRQSGLPDWQLASLNDVGLITTARDILQSIRERYPDYLVGLRESIEQQAAWHQE